ncbi:hypothetical protein [Streptomyces sp. NPDC048057]|uniref:hypothetical protein n=1 Tax=Streptomyces sp. NPDC048057 TaxID=3155628 RepID=UPI0033E5D672
MRSEQHPRPASAPQQPQVDRLRSAVRAAQAGQSRSRRALVLRWAPPAAGAVALLATLLPDGNPLRWLPVVLFLLVGPGAALLRVCAPRLGRHPAVGPVEDWDPHFGRDSDRLEAALLAVFLSVSLAVLGATGLIAVKSLSGTGLLVLLLGVTVAAACCPQLPAGKHRYENPTAPPPRKG